MAAHLVDTDRHPFEIHGEAEMPFRQFHSFSYPQVRQFFTCFEQMLYFLEYPRTTERCPRHHDTVDAISLKSIFGLDGGVYITITYYGYGHSGIAFDFSDQSPVGFSLVHLATGTTVYGECLNSAILQTFS